MKNGGAPVTGCSSGVVPGVVGPWGARGSSRSHTAFWNGIERKG